MKILTLTTDEELSRLRENILKAAGHTVLALSTEKHAQQVVEGNDRFDVAVICHRFPAGAARQCIRLLRHKDRNIKTVYLTHLSGEWPDVEADRYVVGAEGPEALLRVLAELGK